MNNHKRESKSSRAYDNPKYPKNCIVRLYEKYISYWPDGINDIYLTPVPVISGTGTMWCKKCPIDVNTLANVTKDLFKQAGIQRTFTNHSLKRSARTILSNDGFRRDTVIKKTGHLSNNDLDYLEISRKMEIRMSESEFLRPKQLFCSEYERKLQKQLPKFGQQWSRKMARKWLFFMILFSHSC